jgi:glucose-1-phosphate cytidylyltransferase
MKVVLLAGGLGTRMREETEFKPKPMVEIGGKPVLHHLMEIFARQGHTDFIVLAGYRADVIQDYFYNFRARTQAFTVNTGDGTFEVHGELESWNVTVVNTGVSSLTADRLLLAREYIGEEPFMLTYGDGLANVKLSESLALFRSDPSKNLMTTTPIASRFGQVELDDSGSVVGFAEKPVNGEKVNIGFFIFNNEIYRHALPGTMLEDSALRTLAEEGRLRAFNHEGFWMPMDTYREYEKLNELYSKGGAPWLELP